MVTFRVWFAGLVGLMVCGLAGGQGLGRVYPGTDGSGSGLGERRLGMIRSAGIRVILPSVVPKGFRADMLLDRDSGDTRLWWFTVSYTGPEGQKFSLQMGSDGFGDPFFTDDTGEILERTGVLRLVSPLDGKRVEIERRGTNASSDFHTTWLEVGDGREPSHYLFSGEKMSVGDVETVFRGLRVYRPR